jgi:ppGpp synthetase/RelA/SpoT-type nucleotidyltranferase
MHIEELYQGDGLSRIQKILSSHGLFLSELRPVMSDLVANNEEIFRRDPESRIKQVRSIHRKVHMPGMKKAVFFKGVASLRDIAGIRLTIATKDQHARAEELLRKSVEKFGKLVKKDQDGGLAIRETGYSANHFVLISSAHIGTCCEIQIRTLTQDLWAVFSHYESYKRSSFSDNGAGIDEFLNYAKLMDVADDYARAIRRRKILEANEHHRKACISAGITDLGRKGVLTVEALEDIVNVQLQSLAPGKLQGGAIATVRLCELLCELPRYEIYTVQQLLELLSRRRYISHIISRMAKWKVKSRRATDVFVLLCTCHRMNQAEVASNEMGEQMRGLIDGYLRMMQMEEDADMLFEQC